jgi:uncharacterized membrane protein
MITEARIEIEAPATVVWEVFADVERWPEWTASVTRVTPLEGRTLAVGRRFEIKQPRMPKLVWRVSELEPGRSWRWEQRSPGGHTIAAHEVVVIGEARTLVRQQIDQRRLLGAVFGLLTRRMTRRYLTLEAEGLKRVSEERVRSSATTA